MKRVDRWEVIVAVASQASKPKTVRGAKYRMSAFRIAAALDKLARLARTLHRLYEWQCNEPVDGAFEARLERLEGKAAAIGIELGIVVETQRDPRGAAVKLWADKVDGQLLGVFS